VQTESRIVFPVVASATQAFFKMERVSVFIDGENFLYGIKSYKICHLSAVLETLLNKVLVIYL